MMPGGYQTASYDGIAARVQVSDHPLDGCRVASTPHMRFWFNLPYEPDLRVFLRGYNCDDGLAWMEFYVHAHNGEYLDPVTLNFGDPVRRIRLVRVSRERRCTAGVCMHEERYRARLSPEHLDYLLEGALPEWFGVRIKTREEVDMDAWFRRDEARAVAAAAGIGPLSSGS